MSEINKKSNNIFHYVHYLNEENNFKPIIKEKKEIVKFQKNPNKKEVHKG
jgi:hypothetical protein